MLALVGKTKSIARRNFTKRSDFALHPLRNYICSIKHGTCENSESVLLRYKHDFEEEYQSQPDDMPDRQRALLSLQRVFFDVYESGYLWYPRDRWRTAWQIAACCARQSIGDEVESLKHPLYESVSHLRNPSSFHEALK